MAAPDWAGPLVVHTPNMLTAWVEPKAGLVCLVVYASLIVREANPVFAPIRALIERCKGTVIAVTEGILDVDMMACEATLTTYRLDRPEELDGWQGLTEAA